MTTYRPELETTSAAGAMLRKTGGPIVVALLAGLGTTTAHALPANVSLQSPRILQQTNTGMVLMPTERTSASIFELRRLSGLTWDQLARLFKVSRRSLHFWASGKAMTSANEEHLQRLLSAIRKIDRGSAIENRTRLLAVLENGDIPFDLLANGEYDRAVEIVGYGRADIRATFSEISREARAARLPPPPEQLVDALEDRPHREIGKTRTAKSVRIRSDRRS